MYDYIERNNPLVIEKYSADIRRRRSNSSSLKSNLPSANTRPFLAYPEFVSTETTKDLNVPRNAS